MSVRHNGKIQGQLPLLHLGRLGNQLVPVLPNLLQNALQIRGEVDALSVAENLKVAILPAMRRAVQAESAFLSASGAVGRRPLGSLLNRLPRSHRRVLTKRIVGMSGRL